MTTKEIEALLAKYYEGETSLMEEHLLKEFFQGDTIPAHLQEHKSVFNFYSAQAKTEVSLRFDASLQDRIGRGRIVTMNPARKRLAYSLSLAASIALIAGLITLFKLGVFTPSQPYGTITDPQLAYAEARSALYLVSSNLNSGLDRMQHLQSFNTGYGKFEQLNNFQTGLKTLTKMNQLDNYQPIVLNPGRKP
ncbi:MAG: hypothetical protein JXA23_04495 [Bacteroidales bacterium]|nr:hypothetical protein [Bacteroidales bacterium]